ncbi:FGGY family carbohydrate kinase [Candidatus Palauibacter sp.]|uniref:FGGY family carbohydrate kinase n=1 Tax=Candidatus Palauibacter sp. TaxID=3101350 RepID=UPI003B0219BE
MPCRSGDDAARVTREAIDTAETSGYHVPAVGITNHRETTAIRERASGRPVHPAIVWRDRRTAKACPDLPLAAGLAR